MEDAKCVRGWIQGDGDRLPDSISSFIHLQYLDLSWTHTVKLPNFVEKLYNLQTLRLPGTLKELPKEFHKLVRLRHLCIYDRTYNPIIEFPRNIGQLVSLQTLPYFFVGANRGYKVEELGCLRNLRGRLKIYNLQHVQDREEAERAKMLHKLYIQELHFHWKQNLEDSEVNHENVLEGLEPPCYLRCLLIENYGGRSFVSWMWNRDAHENLMRIELKYCILCEQIPPLGHLPHLEVIEMVGLDNLKRIGPEFYGHHVFNNEGIVVRGSRSSSGAIGGAQAIVFPALRKFTLSNMSNLEEWLDIPSFPGDTRIFFPCLEILIIKDCPGNKVLVDPNIFSKQPKKPQVSRGVRCTRMPSSNIYN
ncbi:putative disease resistance RPP13-like protein 1 isoform X1 [Actinidia eriantha]|uniref:putative disease resistance RPP13-like protein 1 isoform X1 n=1 Tax=Actinidia eriantha TaxID=165200 RepID=UPI002585E071|nr:putative disease resistance RPP13-like protein 1 isoform X1 [Actinidia eriantha]XP_057499691.1 putative disease resistance RPP13-like protein 1 isoform X1 [Actinidia eriantha]XP_057499692.1 putative disease resistance RPP13-like protein 1 isoform X1 [Actinidia eriantha]